MILVYSKRKRKSTRKRNCPKDDSDVWRLLVNGREKVRAVTLASTTLVIRRGGIAELIMHRDIGLPGVCVRNIV